MNNEDILLMEWEKAKATDIERLLSQYGDSLSEVREMYPKLTSALVSRPQAALPTQPVFFTASEARDMGVDIEEGWMLKLTPSGAEKG